MLVFAVAFLSLAAFSGVPSRPYGEWGSDAVGPGRVDSPRWPGLPSDNTLPFRTGQVALYKQGGAAIRDQYSPGWWLSDRTPLTGLDFAFAVSALGVHVTSANVEEQPVAQVPMMEVDRQGFWAYQLVAMYLNLSIVLGVYLLGRVWLGRRVAVLACLIASVMPGLFLNAIYTWPKEAVGYFILAAAACAVRRKPLLAGGFVGLAYLTHPVGVLWLPAVALLLLTEAELRVRVWRTLGRFVAAAAALAAPWLFFTSQIMHATSRWLTAPLGYLMTDPRHLGAQLALAWHAFLSNGPLFAIWTRIQSTAGSVFPLDLSATPAKLPAGGFGPQVMVSWSAVHGFSVWGMVGLVLFPFTLIVVTRQWDVFRRFALWFVVPALIAVELWNGEAYPFANQSMFPLVGLLAIPAAYGLQRARQQTRVTLLAVMAIELLTMVYGGLYRPFGIDAPSAVVLTCIAGVGQIGLFVALGVQLDIIRWRPRGRSTAAPSMATT
jgi:4-amino-4-deoxy-L-arabinose transferase-like glycosyltransferase